MPFGLGDSRPRTDWSRRYKTNVACLKSGDREQVATVVQQLTDREATKGLSQGEKRMLDRAEGILRNLDDDA